MSASGRWSLRIQFNGEKNLAYDNVAQLAYVTPGAYRFEAYIRSAAVTTDRGVGFRIVDAAGAYPLNVSTEHFPATTQAGKPPR